MEMLFERVNGQSLRAKLGHETQISRRSLASVLFCFAATGFWLRDATESFENVIRLVDRVADLALETFPMVDASGDVPGQFLLARRDARIGHASGGKVDTANRIERSNTHESLEQQVVVFSASRESAPSPLEHHYGMPIGVPRSQRDDMQRKVLTNRAPREAPLGRSTWTMGVLRHWSK
jgi:hypothetical protein